MLRVGLDDLVLQILLLDLGEPSAFLAKAGNLQSALAVRNSLKLRRGWAWSSASSTRPRRRPPRTTNGRVSRI